MKIKVSKPKTSSGGHKQTGSRKGYRPPQPTHTAQVPDTEQEGKLTRIGVLKRFASGKYKGRGFTLHIDDDPRAKQLAYENLERIVLIPTD